MAQQSPNHLAPVEPAVEVGESAALMARFLESADNRSRSTATRKRDEFLLNAFSRSLGARPVLSATTADITAWLDHDTPGWSNRSECLGRLSRFFAWTVVVGLLDASPTAALRRRPELPQRIPATPPQFADSMRLIGRYLAASAGQGRAASTRTLDESVVVAFARSLGATSLERATTSDIARWLDADPPLGVQSRMGYLSKLHRFFTWALAEGLIDTCPTVALRRSLMPRSTDASATDLVDRFMACGEQQRLGPKTRIRERRRLLQLAQSLAARCLLDTNAADVDAWLERTPALSPTARTAWLRSVRPFFEWAVDEGLLDTSPVPAVVRRPRPAVLVNDAPSVLPDGVWSLADVARLYILTRRRRGEVTENTAVSTRSALASLNQVFGDGDIQELSEEHIDRWLELNSWQAPATRRGNRSYIKGFCQWLVRKGYIADDPTADLPSVRQPRRLPRCLPASAVSALLQACPDTRDTLIVLLQVQLGLRCAEVSALTVEDFSFPDHSVLVHGKGGRKRILPVDPETWQALVAHLTERPTTTGPLIRADSRAARGLSAGRISHLVSRAMYAAGVKRGPKDGVSAHALRHTACADMLRGGAELRDVQTAMGHATIDATELYMPLVVRGLQSAMGGRHYGTPNDDETEHPPSRMIPSEQLRLPFAERELTASPSRADHQAPLGQV